jgi:uncharacterized membrane protein
VALALHQHLTELEKYIINIKMIRIILVILLFCYACVSTKVTEKHDTSKETKTNCCSKK